MGGTVKTTTERQEKILTFIKRFIEEYNHPPTYREIAARFNISPKGAWDNIEALERKGKLKTEEGKCRSIELTEKITPESDIVYVPIVGDVAAGTPILSEENFEGEVPIHRSMLKEDKNYFAMKIRGDSMMDAGILDGDTVIIEKRPDANNGDIVVADINGGITLKYFFKESRRVRLEPANADPQYRNIYTTDAQIAGKLAFLVRNYSHA
jgi:repressor LexA